jgi:hypothetical protein
MLRSLNELEGYALGAIDGDIGRVKDFLFDDEGWAVRYLSIDTRSWLSSRKVLISPIVVAAQTLDRAAEFRLHEHYRRTGYWADEVQRENPEFRPVKAAPERAVHKYT